ncbi:MAG: glycosyltransferase family 4 protein [Chitinispirillaceae bacterium]|nr:glycosyltransferase family 4 protein [Chitinispirillaceae bacterium]
MDTALPFGFNVIGFISCNIGLGVAARNTVFSLIDCGYKAGVYDIALPGRSGSDTTYSPIFSDMKEPPHYAVNIFHLNPPQLEQIRHHLHADFLKGRLNVAVPFWELPRIPDSWALVLEKIHVALAPSRFIEHAVACFTSRCRVLYYPQAITTGLTIKPGRCRFGLPENKFLFVTSFDIGSDLVRKNPIGAIDAFRRAFPSGNSSAEFIIKINRTVTGPFFDGLITKIQGYINDDPRIRIIDSPMSYEEILSLYASCDCFVSLHRAEGLGLGAMESMSLGKPVIATFWSGTADFMTPENSCPVTYKIVKCDPSCNPGISPESLGFQGVWAEPDGNEAAAWMRKLFEDRELCRRLGAQARISMEQRGKQAREGHVFRMIKSIYSSYCAGIYSSEE